MNRERLFRAMDEMTLDWVHGVPVFDSDIKGRAYIVHGCTDGLDKIIVKPETIGEWSGVIDTTEAHVFEGDILDDGKGGYGVVIFAAPQFCVSVGDDIFSLAEGKVNVQKLAYTKIVGNIHEHPELLCTTPSEP